MPIIFISSILNGFLLTFYYYLTVCGRIQSLPALPSDIHCSLDTTCYNITCCTDILGVGRSLSIALSVDSCRYTVSLQMERLQRNISLMKYEWGEFRNVQLVNEVKTNEHLHTLSEIIDFRSTWKNNNKAYWKKVVVAKVQS